MTEKGSCGSFTAGLILGAIAGAVVALLYAPKTGRETRELLKQKAEEAREKAEEIVEKAKEAAATARERVEQKIKKEAA